MEREFQGQPVRFDLSGRTSDVSPWDPYACPACGGVGTVPVWRKGILGPNPTSGERPCDRCKGLGLDPEPPADEDPGDLV